MSLNRYLKLGDTLASWPIEFRVFPKGSRSHRDGASIKFLVANAIISLRELYDELIQNRCHKRYIIWTKELRKVT